MRTRSLPPASLQASTTGSRTWSVKTWADKSAPIQSRRSCSRWNRLQRGEFARIRTPPDRAEHALGYGVLVAVVVSQGGWIGGAAVPTITVRVDVAVLPAPASAP